MARCSQLSRKVYLISKRSATGSMRISRHQSYNRPNLDIPVYYVTSRRFIRTNFFLLPCLMKLLFFLLLPETSKKSARPIIFIVVYLKFSTEVQQHCKVDPVVSRHQEYISDILFRNLKFPALCGLAVKQISSLF